jgi:hypothetical protein
MVQSCPPGLRSCFHPFLSVFICVHPWFQLKSFPVHVREYKSSDLDALRRMHAAQGFGYPLPDLESPLFLSKLVVEDDGEDGVRPLVAARRHTGSGREAANANSPPADSSRVTMAILQRLTAETYLLHDPAAGTPRCRWKCFLALHEAARDAAIERGLDDVQAFLPPPIARAFGRRLIRLGWTRDPWPCFSRRIP